MDTTSEKMLETLCLSFNFFIKIKQLSTRDGSELCNKYPQMTTKEKIVLH